MDKPRLFEQVLERAFLQYVNEQHLADAQRLKDTPGPEAIACCRRCGFPVYRTEHGDGLFHYSYESSYDLASHCCGMQPDTGEATNA